VAVVRARSQLWSTCAVLVALACVLAVSAQHAGATDAGCDVWAAPPEHGGDNSNPGTEQAPVATIRKLLAIVPRGHDEGSRGVACVRKGTYDFSSSLEATVSKPWTTLRPAAGEDAKLIGRLVVSVKARHAVVEGLTLDGWRPRAKSPSLMVFGDWAEIRDNKITNDSTAICVHVSDYYGDRARNVTIDGNEIYGCGALRYLNHDHGIYVADADGTRILDNFVHDNQDRGIQLWPDADGTLVQGNTVDHNGEGISIGGQRTRHGRQLTSDDNLIRGNLIMRSHASYADPDGPGPVQSNTHGWNLEFVHNRHGSGNVIESNCFYADHPDPNYTTNGGINLADSNGVPVSARIVHNAVLNQEPGQAGPALGRSGCEDESIAAAALPHDCASPLLGHWTGTPGPDRFDGTDLPDYADGGEGDDSLSGAGGADCLYGGGGRDTVAGDADRDRLFGDDLDDTIISREPSEADWRSDEVSCGAGTDFVFADITDVVDDDCETVVYRDPE